ncbi:MAG: C-GCAxxG-C-C family protein [Candidatus Omnitrophota bacterium]
MTADKKEQAKAYFKKGYNCAQAVLCAFASDFQMDEEAAFRVSCGYGGGIARMQYTCGALTGAVMVLGLHFGKDGESYEQIKVRTYEQVRRLFEEFKTRHQAIDCIELLGLSMNDDAQRKQIKEKNLHETLCEKLVCDAVEIVEGIIAGKS